MPEAMYLDPEARRYYLIPDGVELAPGTLRLEGARGQRLEIDPDLAAIYEASEEQVAEHLRGLFTGALEGLRARTASGATQQAAARALGLPDDALSDPQRVREAIRGALDAWKKTGNPPVSPEVLQERLARLSALAREHGLPELADAGDALPGKLRALAADPATLDGLRSATAALRQATEELRANRKRSG